MDYATKHIAVPPTAESIWEIQGNNEPIISESRVKVRILIDHEQIATFCRKWTVEEIPLFGSVLCDDFRAKINVDVSVSFEADAPWSLWDLVSMRDELIRMFGRNVDLVEKGRCKILFGGTKY